MPRHRTAFLRAPAEVDLHMAVDIEHEDAAHDRLEGLTPAAEDLRAAAEELWRRAVTPRPGAAPPPPAAGAAGRRAGSTGRPAPWW